MTVKLYFISYRKGLKRTCNGHRMRYNFAQERKIFCRDAYWIANQRGFRQRPQDVDRDMVCPTVELRQTQHLQHLRPALHRYGIANENIEDTPA